MLEWIREVTTYLIFPKKEQKRDKILLQIRGGLYVNHDKAQQSVQQFFPTAILVFNFS